ncbi:amino acid ABC transporter substrate-binding protein [Allostella vacuolata]|nr:amino acid ABC transporter substrate-binding protein [Stella vacuolata]
MHIPLLAAAFGAVLAIAAAVPASAQAPGDTVATIRARGEVTCGVTPDAPGFATRSARGAWTGFEVDYCRAVASVVLGDPDKVRYVPVPTQHRLDALQRGEIDLLPRNTTWTLEREAGNDVAFAAVIYYDGQSFMLRGDRGIRRVQQMDGLKVCVETATTTEQNAVDYARAMRLRLTIVPTPDLATAQAAFLAGFCDALTSDQSVLAGFRRSLGSRADEFVLLGEIISKEPLSIVVRRGDWRFFNIVRWTHFAMLAAEELNVDSGTVRELRARSEADLGTTRLEVQRLLGRVGSSGAMLGLDADWAARLVAQVGNYREVWERNIAPLGIRRGLNLLWNQGGLQYAPPMR